MFTLNYDHPIQELEPNWHADWALFIARFLAALFLVTALVVKLSLRARNFVIKFSHSRVFFRGQQYLIIGYGRVGKGLARALKEKHPEKPGGRHRPSMSNPWTGRPPTMRGSTCTRPMRGILTGFKKVPIDIGRISKTLVSVGRDQQTIATASRLVERLSATVINPVWMQLNDWTLLDRLRNSTSLSVAAKGERKLRSFSMAEALGTQIIAKYRPALMAAKLRAEPPACHPHPVRRFHLGDRGSLGAQRHLAAAAARPPPADHH